jgi:hypothetical protein
MAEELIAGIISYIDGDRLPLGEGLYTFRDWVTVSEYIFPN